MKTLKSPDSAFSGSIRRKPDFLPKVFVSNDFDNAYIPLLARCFEQMIVTAHNDSNRAWDDLLGKLEKHGLFDITIPNEIILGPMEFQLPDGAGGTETRVYERTEPLAFGFERVRLNIDRAQVASEAYRKESSAILAYLFAWRLFVQPLKPHHVALVRLDAVSLSEYLHSHHRGQVSVDSLARFIIARTIDDLLVNTNALANFDGLTGKIVGR